MHANAAAMTSTLSLQLAERCHGDWTSRFSRPERSALTEVVRRALCDTAACILAGRDEQATQVVRAWIRQYHSGVGPSEVLFGDGRAESAIAALVNGVAGHALDYDDIGLSGHPSVVIVPALLAERERSNRCGFEVVQAYAKGYAVWGDLQRRLKVSLHERGWHPTSVFGVLAAAMAVASLRRLDARCTAHALGIAASFAGGVVANFGSSTKPMHIGRAAQAGIQAVELAQSGLESSPEALDGETGLLVALTGDRSHVRRYDPVGDEFERTLLLRRPGIKRYPVCYAIHRVVDGLLRLIASNQFSPADVLSVEVQISETAAGVLRYHTPQTVTEARFSIEFCVAVAITRGSLDPAQVSEGALRDDRIRVLMSRVKISTVNTRCPLEPSFAYADQVTVILQDARVLNSGPIRYAVGHPDLPMNDEQVFEKLRCSVKQGEEALATRILHQIETWLGT